MSVFRVRWTPEFRVKTPSKSWSKSMWQWCCWKFLMNENHWKPTMFCFCLEKHVLGNQTLTCRLELVSIFSSWDVLFEQTYWLKLTKLWWKTFCMFWKLCMFRCVSSKHLVTMQDGCDQEAGAGGATAGGAAWGIRSIYQRFEICCRSKILKIYIWEAHSHDRKS